MHKNRLEYLFEAAEKLYTSDDPQKKVEELCLIVLKYLDCQTFLNFLLDEQEMKFRLNAYSGISDKLANDIEWLDYNNTISGRVVQSGRMIVSENVQKIPDPRCKMIKSLGIRAYACYSLMEQDKVIGTLSFGTSTRDTFSSEDLVLMKGLANQISVALNRINTEKILRKQNELLLAVERERNEALENVIKMKDKFFYTISHEFKTPITVISVAVQAIEFLCKDDLTDKLRGYLATIKHNILRQTRLATNLLDITGVENNHLKLNIVNLDIVFLTRTIVSFVKPYADQKGVNVSFESYASTKVIALDDDKYERIILNLLSNAIKFTSKEDSISIKIFKEKDKVCITVTDTGIGIPKDKIGTIFERFGQVDNSISRQAEGTGIGLSLVKMLTMFLGGTIDVDCDMEKGSSFTLCFCDTKIYDENNVERPLQHISDYRINNAVAVEFSDIYL